MIKFTLGVVPPHRISILASIYIYIYPQKYASGEIWSPGKQWRDESLIDRPTRLLTSSFGNSLREFEHAGSLVYVAEN